MMVGVKMLEEIAVKGQEVSKAHSFQNHYCYNGLLRLNNQPSNRRAVQQLADQFRHLGLRYSIQRDMISILIYRPRQDAEILIMLNELAKILPNQNCYRIEAICQDDSLDYGYLIYNGAVYLLNNLHQPRKPIRMLVGQRAVATSDTKSTKAEVELRGIA
jgi:hypothetical protein